MLVHPTFSGIIMSTIINSKTVRSRIDYSVGISWSVLHRLARHIYINPFSSPQPTAQRKTAIMQMPMQILNPHPFQHANLPGEYREALFGWRRRGTTTPVTMVQIQIIRGKKGGRVEIFQKRQDAPSALIVTNRDNNKKEKHHTPIFISSGGK